MRRENGGNYAQPVRRNTALRSFALARGLRDADMRISLNHSKVIDCGQ